MYARRAPEVARPRGGKPALAEGGLRRASKASSPLAPGATRISPARSSAAVPGGARGLGTIQWTSSSCAVRLHRLKAINGREKINKKNN